MKRMKPTCYIAGPMRGKPDYNRAAFNAAAKRLAEACWHPINPVEIERVLPCVDEDGTLNGVRLCDLLHAERAFAERADAIYLLDGWEKSVGARGELQAYLNSATNGGRVMVERGTVMSAADGKAAMAAHAARIAAHYDHARAKHPDFAELMFIKEKEKSFANDAASRLAFWRIITSHGEPEAESVLMCELAEASHAYALGNKAEAVKELYDTVAVLLRMVDVLEGRQALGAPEKAWGKE